MLSVGVFVLVAGGGSASRPGLSFAEKEKAMVGGIMWCKMGINGEARTLPSASSSRLFWRRLKRNSSNFRVVPGLPRYSVAQSE